MIAETVPPLFERLSPFERRDLLWLARESIRTLLTGEAEPTLQQPTVALLQPTAAFVSLHQQGRLRGCVGTLVAEGPLNRTVLRMARSAACDDPRFPPLSLIELPELDIEISRLSPPTPAHPDEVCPGRHGVCVQLGDRRGVFLPQVATTYHWDRETLLREVCLKAMLSPDAWRHTDLQLRIFEAEVFGECDSP